MTPEHILKALRAVRDPDLGRDIVSLGFVKDVQAQGGRVAFTIELTTPACPVRDQMKEQARAVVAALPGISQVEIRMTSQVRTSIPSPSLGTLPTVKNIIAIASGKGGVGKSTVCANLAHALARTGASVGVMDADVYGPSIPTILGVAGAPAVDAQNRMTPVEHDGLKIISMGFFLKPGEAMIWRGPMLHKTVQQFLGGVHWGALDYLLVDTPPGCVTADTLVFTEQGPMPICAVKEGMVVYSFDGTIQRSSTFPPSPWKLCASLVRRRVNGVIPQGQAAVYELRTPTRAIRGTADHPILVVHRDKRPRSREHVYSLRWKKLGEIRPRDIVLIVKRLPQAHGQPLKLPRPRVTARVPVQIPTQSSDEFLRLVGYFLGDGTVRTMTNGNYWGVWFSEPVGGVYRPRYVRLMHRLFGLAHIHQQPMKFAALSNQVAELFDQLALHKPALQKNVPPWVFTLPESQKLALIEGVCDADGHRRMARAGHRRRGWMCFDSPNKTLMEGVRALCIDVGFKVGNLTCRTRSIRLPSTGQRVSRTFYAFESNRAAKTDLYGAGLIRGPAIGKGLRHEHFGFERVKSVRSIGAAEVYDLQVEGQHNFVADGFVVHNTGDVTLSLCQSIPITGAAIVSTPQDVALNVAQKAIAMFQKLNAPILGIIENMSRYVCPHCGKAEAIFGEGGARKTAERLGIPFLGEIPLATPIRVASDAGTPIVLTQPDSPVAKAFIAAAEQLAAQVSIRAMQGARGADINVTF